MPPLRSSVKRLRVQPDPDDAAEDDPSIDDPIRCIEDSVFFYAEVTSANVLRLLHCLSRANAHALSHCASPHDARVYLYIHSPGGDAYAGLSGLDHIRNNRLPVTTIVDGFVASAATFLLLGGSHRVALSHGTCLIHQLSTGFWGKYADLVDEVKNSTSLMKTFKKIYGERTSLDKAAIDSLLKKELTLDARKCLSMGIVDEVW